MTNSTVEAGAGKEAPAPKPKRQGPIRTEAIVPFAIIVALVWAYFHFFFDGHLRRGIEYVGTQANGAEVNVGELQTSVWHASLVVRDVQVTDSAQPTRNLVQIGSMSFQMLWDALLRGKVVVDHADILDIQVLSPRTKPGRVLPVEPETTGFSDTLLANVRSQFDGNVLGDLAALAAGADPAEQLAKLGNELKSSAHLAALQTELAQKEQEWKVRLANLPKSETLTALEQRLRAVKVDRFKDLQEVQASVKELEAIRDEINANVKNVEGTGKALGSDINAYKNVYAELEQVVKQDIADLQAHLRIPELDAKTLANVLFGPEVFAKVADARGYMDKARTYMPPKRTAEEKAALRLQPHERAEGRNYAFGRPNAYPAFWLKRAAIGSKSGAGPYAGDLTGELRDVTTAPDVIGRPTVAQIRGSFPGLDIYDTNIELVLDHTTERPVERLTAQIGRYGVASRALVSSDAVNLGFAKADGRTLFSAELSGNQVDLRLNNDFTGVAYQVQAKSPLAQEIITGALSGVTAVNVNARVSGTWDHLDWYLATNLGDALEQGFRKQVQAKLEQARARLQAMVNDRIAAERKKLQDQYAAVEASVKAQIAAKQAEVERLKVELEKAKAQFEAEKTKLIKGQEQKLKAEEQKIKKEADKYLNDLRKKL